MEELLKKLIENTFIPTIDIPSKLPDEAGAYLICAKNIDCLPVRMKENLIMHFVAIGNPMEFELYLINTFEPTLNLKDNNSEKNRDFREELSQLRTR